MSSKNGVGHTDTSSVDKEELIAQFEYLNILKPSPWAEKILSKPPLGRDKISVVLSGAGLAGITTGILLSEKIDNIELTILERSPEYGGVWFDNQYPGIQVDVPVHAYQLSFDPKRDWPSAYAAGKDIRQYWGDKAKKHGLEEKTKFGHNIKEAKWDAKSHQWVIQAEHEKKTVEFRADVFIGTSGVLSNPRYPPTQPGFDSFEGIKFHPQKWPQDLTLDDLKGKRVALIGNGATGVQILPQIVGKAAHVDHYAKGATWIAHTLFGPGVPGYVDYSKEDIESIKADKDYHEFQKELHTNIGGKYNFLFYGTPYFRELVKELLAVIWVRVGKDKELFRKLVPTYPPGGKRLLPAPGYLESLTKPNVDVHLGEIKEFTKKGIVGFDGVEREADIIIAATGYPLTNGDGFTPNFEIIGKDGYTLKQHFSPQESKLGYSASYLGLAAPGFPNLFYTLSVNSYITESTVVQVVELQASYIARAIRKKQLEKILSLEPSLKATLSFNKRVGEISEATCITKSGVGFFSEVTKDGTRRTKIDWPGSTTHNIAVLREPRWEDYEYEYADNNDPFAYFGSGKTWIDDHEGDKTFYLAPPGTDAAHVHEGWISLPTDGPPRIIV
ncbi:putative sterigmatocystin biosynthesis monooxygenase stcW [Yarrowia sp. B02]|nr:putative sterigmatocystin biosynthesis monooxygenase stcW [Yarrowia sp. B02]